MKLEITMPISGSSRLHPGSDSGWKEHKAEGIVLHAIIIVMSTKTRLLRFR